MTFKEAINWAAVFLQGIAAILWIASTLVRVKAADVVAEYEKTYGVGSGPSQIVTEDGDDFGATIKRQAYWNKWAAMMTGIGIATQAIANALPS